MRNRSLRRHAFDKRGVKARSGQALIETCLVVSLLCLLLFGLFQVAQMYAAQEVLDHAAVAGARARAVGFNDFMVEKVVRVASIPNAGRMNTPEVDTSSADAGFWGRARPGEAFDVALTARPTSPQAQVELSRIPLYLAATSAGQLPAILNYEDWHTIRRPSVADSDFALVSARVRQDWPLRFPFHRAFYAGDVVRMEGEARMDNHYPRFLE